MIIVSQDKRIITNFDNTIGLQINEHILNSDEERDFEIRAITEKRSCVIAFYDTEARAKKVLQEIISRYEYAQRNLADSNDTSPFNEVFVYKMPLEEE